MDSIDTIQAYLSAEIMPLTSDQRALDKALQKLLAFQKEEEITDTSRPVLFVTIPKWAFQDEAAPYRFLAMAQKSFLTSNFDMYQPLVFISSERWNDKCSPEIPQMRAFRVTDSSIWNYHLYLIDVENGEYDTGRLEWILKSIYNNYERGLYSLHASCEYANLNARLVQQSYLEGAHAPICPFIFHSEYEMKKTLEEKEERAKDRCKQHKWRILMVDDKSQRKMRSTDKTKEVNKLGIIVALIHELFPDKIIATKSYNDNTVIPDDTFLLIEYAENLDQAKEAMIARKYDIVLLDYLLSEGDDPEKEFGYMLLKDIESGKTETLSGPAKKNYFLFMSAYVTAVNDRLSAEMLQRDKKDLWHISEGACPTNTPNRFKLLLLRLMDKRIVDIGIDKLSGNYVANEMVWKVFSGEGSVRKRANAYYQEVLNLLYHYKRLLGDVEIPESGFIMETGGSVLMTSVCLKLPQFGGFLEHLSNLLHLIAFGTVRQWPEMWEEFIYFKTQLQDIYIQKPGDVPSSELFKAIEKYILNIKSILR